MDIQTSIDQVRAGGTFGFNRPEETEGPVVLRKPISIDGAGGSLWARKGPVLTIESHGVQVRNLSVCVTGRLGNRDDETTCAIRVAQGITVTFEKVVVFGYVSRLEGEAGDWYYPHSLDFGELKPDEEHEFKMQLAMPAACSLESKIGGLTLQPGLLRAGVNEVTVKIDKLPPGTRLRGDIEIPGNALCRCISMRAAMPSTATNSGHGQLLYSAPTTARTPYVPPPPPVPPPAPGEGLLQWLEKARPVDLDWLKANREVIQWAIYMPYLAKEIDERKALDLWKEIAAGQGRSW